MARRTKEELQASNYYAWLSDCDALRKKKKEGGKLSLKEKEILRTVPSPESPFVSQGEDAPKQESSKRKRSQKTAKPVSFDKNVNWKTAGGHFLCAVFDAPFADEQCMLFCKVEDCPFYQVGYFRAHGVHF